MNHKVFCIILLFLHLIGRAQEVKIDSVYTFEKIDKSTSFAALTLGGDILSLEQAKTNINGQSTTLLNQFMPRFNIGGTHFWGHADFYISIPLTQVPLKKSDSTNFTFNRSVVTGARYLPWAYQADKLRPYIGGSWAIVNFQNKIKPEENQPLLSKTN